MVLDRKLQLELMQKMAESYPFSYQFPEYKHGTSQYHQAAINLRYLQSHGLVEEGSTLMRPSSTGTGGGIIVFGKPTLNHKGMDFLTDDGGLSAILNVITVKFEADTLKAILANKINESDLSPEDKSLWTDMLRELPAESIKHLTTTLLDKGLENLPGLMILIGTYLGLPY